jgi:DNA adenine methylase
MKIQPPITWLGGKSKLAPRIVDWFPPHHTYCEPFGGSAAVLLAKVPSAVEVYNDIDGDLVNLFRVIREPSLFARLRAAAESTLYARAEFDAAQEATSDPVDRALRFLVRQRQSYGGLGERWSWSVEDSSAGMASPVRRWQAGVERLSLIHARIKSVQIEQADWRTVIERFDGARTLFYLDPPYVPETRIGGAYRHEMTQADHHDLVKRLVAVKGMVVLSGYDHVSYEPLEVAGWVRHDYSMPAYTSDARTRRTECLWLSPALVVANRDFLSAALDDKVEPSSVSVRPERNLPPFHPVSFLFPTMTKSEFDALVADIGEHGQREPILVYEGLVADGRHRWSACAALGIKPKVEHWRGDEESLIRHIISVNLVRRHLSATERALLAVRYANLPKGINRFSIGAAIATSMRQSDASRLFSVSIDSIQRARKVESDGADELVSALREGKISLHVAARLARLTKDEQREAVTVGALVRAAQTDKRRALARATIQSERPDAAFPKGRFDIAVIDPPWDYGNPSLSTHCSPGFHYRLMSIADIAAMKLPLARDALVFVWVPAYFLDDLLTRVLPAWRLSYAGCAVWRKPRAVVGAGLFRMTHEMIVAARRGAGAGKPDKQLMSVFDAPQGRHSEKPPVLMDWIDEMFPAHLRRIEVFARSSRAGWESFGDDPAIAQKIEAL